MNETYIPYEATAHQEVVVDSMDKDFIVNLLPGITVSELDVLLHHIKGRFHDGLEMGTSLSVHDPISALEAYRIGETDGYDRALSEFRKGEQ